MASKHAHAAKARQNEAALGRFYFDPDAYDWYITVTFYAAVHWVRAYLADAGRGAGAADDLTYEDFPRLVREVCRARKGAQSEPAEVMLDAFQILKKLSKKSRYRCEPSGWYGRQTGDADAALRTVRDFVLREVPGL